MTTASINWKKKSIDYLHIDWTWYCISSFLCACLVCLCFFPNNLEIINESRFTTSNWHLLYWLEICWRISRWLSFCKSFIFDKVSSFYWNLLYTSNWGSCKHKLMRGLTNIHPLHHQVLHVKWRTSERSELIIVKLTPIGIVAEPAVA